MFVLAVLINVAQQWGFPSASTEQIDFQLRESQLYLECQVISYLQTIQMHYPSHCS